MAGLSVEGVFGTEFATGAEVVDGVLGRVAVLVPVQVRHRQTGGIGWDAEDFGYVGRGGPQGDDVAAADRAAAGAFLDREPSQRVGKRVRSQRESDARERARFVQHHMENLRNLERIRTEGRTPDLAAVQNNLKAVERAIQHERTMNNRALEGLGLSPEHSELVKQVLDNELARTLERAAGQYREEIVRQVQAIVAEVGGREPRERILALEQAAELARGLSGPESGKGPGPAKVREAYDLIQQHIQQQKEIEGRVIGGLGLSPENVQAVSKALEADRLQKFGKEMDTLQKDLVREYHNSIVGNNSMLMLDKDRVKTLDLKAYELCVTRDPIGQDLARGVYIYQESGKAPIEEGYSRGLIRPERLWRYGVLT